MFTNNWFLQEKGHITSRMPPSLGSRASAEAASQGSLGLTTSPEEQIRWESPLSMRNIRCESRVTAWWSWPYCNASVLTLVRVMMACTRWAGWVVLRKHKIEWATDAVIRFRLYILCTTRGCLLGRSLRKPRLLPGSIDYHISVIVGL